MQRADRQMACAGPRLTRRRALAAFGMLGAEALIAVAVTGPGAGAAGTRGLMSLLEPGVAFAQPDPPRLADVAFAVNGTSWLQQLIGDVDVVKQLRGQSEPWWHPTDRTPNQENSIGYYPGGPAIKRSDGEVWSQPGSSVAPAPFPDGPTPQLGYYYNVFGSDKARSFTAADGNLIMLMGDIRGQTKAPYDTIAYSDTSDPEPASGGPVGMDLRCYTSDTACFPKQPRNESDPKPAAFNGPYTLLVFPTNPNKRQNPLSLKFSVEDMGPNSAPYAGVYVRRRDDPAKSATYVTLRLDTVHVPGLNPAPPDNGGCAEIQHCVPPPPKSPYDTWLAEPGTSWASVLTRFNAAYATDPKLLLPKLKVDPANAFEYLRVISQTPYKQVSNGQIVPLDSAVPSSPCFIQTALHCYDSSYPSYASSGLGPQPASGGHLLTFGTGTFRGPLTVVQPLPPPHQNEFDHRSYDLSTVFLSAQDYADIESSDQGTRYFTGLQSDGASATWTRDQSADQAGPVLGGTSASFAYKGIGDCSVACLLNQHPAVPELWLMMCDGNQPNGWPFAGVQLFWSLSPWGPWQPASATGQGGVFSTTEADGDPSTNPYVQQPITHDGQQQPSAGNGLNGPVISPSETNTVDAASMGGLPANSASFKAYGPMLIEKFCKLTADASNQSTLSLTVYWTLCTWIPYYSVLMKSHFTLSI